MFNYSARVLNIGYKELGPFSNKDGSHKPIKFSISGLEVNTLPLTPNLDGSFKILFMPFEGDNSFDLLKERKDAAFF
jgi:kynurenine 3-monooxygenase